MDIKRIKICLFIFLSSLFASCSQFTTPIYNDPIFSQDPTNTSTLGKGGEVYSQRDDKLSDQGTLIPHPGESYNDFTLRIANTIKAQEYQIRLIEQSTDKKKASIQNLQKQLPTLQAKHIELRLHLMRVTQSDTLLDKKGHKLFKRHVIRENETLQKIAYEYYGTYTGWLGIYRFNREQLTNGPNHIHPGQILYIPSTQEK